MRLEMLQVARLSPNLLGDSAKLVEAFIRGQQHESGAFVDLDGRPDLYYTVFAMNGLAALQAELEGDQKSALEKYLDTFQDVTRLDYVHLCCLARALAGKEDARRDAIAEELETYRSADGGYNAGEKGAETGSVYGCFLALGAVQDIERELPNPEGIIACVESMQTPDGAYANEAALPMGTTTTTAAAIEIFRVLGREIDPEVGHWMLSQMHPEGGFYAMPAAPIPDLLTTATVLHALAGIQVSFEPVKEHVLDFIDTLWTNRGGFYGNWMEETVDVEYTFYGLLALGHLSL